MANVFYTVNKRALYAFHVLLPVLLVLASCIELSDAAAVVDVYRLIEYDVRGLAFGSRRAGLSHHASSGLSVPGSDLARAVVVMPIAKVDTALLNEVLHGKRFVGGFLLLLPQSFGSGEETEAEGDDDNETLQAIAKLEQLLLHNNCPVPIYFAVENENLKKLAEEVAANDAAGVPATAANGGYKLVVNSPEPRKLPTVSLANIQGWLHGLRIEGESRTLPTIAIVASYDTFGAVPALSVGSDSNGSGVVALLELVRLFSRLYADPKSRGRYNLLFGLTSGGPYNYDGTKQWLASLDQRLLETVEFVICLNSIGQWTEKVYIHGSKPKKDPAIAPLYEGLEAMAQELGFSLEVVHKKINMSDSRVPWEHELFSRNKIPAVTLSELESAPELFGHTGGLADRRWQINEKAVLQSIKLIAETLARHIFDYKGRQMEVFANGSSLSPNPLFVSHWLRLFARTPRVAAYLPKGAPVVAALQKELAGRLSDVKVQTVPLDSAFVFFDSPEAKLEIYKVASVTFDVLIMLAVASYLGALFLILHISTKGFDDLMGVFWRPPSRKMKAT